MYINNKTKILIVCPIHGIFEQRPSSHINEKFGCSKCSYDKNKYSFKNFLEKSNKIHNGKYMYNKESFINIHSNVEILCPIHGNFNQIAKNHISGRGCKKCKNERIGKLKRKELDDFIIDGKKVHGNKYDYSLVKYVNNKTKVKIICSEHGVFEQRPDDHTKGNGCFKCSKSRGENIICEYLLKHNIVFTTEKTFNGCHYKRKLKFDFYLPDYNICVEYDGIQHYKSLKFFGGKKALKLQQIKDDIKNKYCIDNNIKLIRIKYNENIIEKLISI
jgi:hypothetical protein